MSKELEALERIKKWFPFKVNELEYQNICIIENALKEYEGAKKHIEALNKERVENSIKLKALEIIKGIILNVYNWELVEDNGKYKILEDSGFIELEKWQYELLKEVLL